MRARQFGSASIRLKCPRSRGWAIGLALLIAITLNLPTAHATTWDGRPKMFLHVAPKPSESRPPSQVCASVKLNNAKDAVTVGLDQTAAPNQEYVVYLCIASGNPERPGAVQGIQGARCGIDFDSVSVSINTWSSCADYEVQDNRWPRPGGNLLVGWPTSCPRGDVIVAGYMYITPYSPGVIAITPATRAFGPSDLFPSVLAAVKGCGSATPDSLNSADLGWAFFSPDTDWFGCNPALVNCDYFPDFPVVDSVDDPSAYEGDAIRLSGSDLLHTLEVSFGGISTTQILSASDSHVSVIVPRGAASGPLRLRTVSGWANAGLFTVLRSSGQPVRLAFAANSPEGGIVSSALRAFEVDFVDSEGHRVGGVSKDVTLTLVGNDEGASLTGTLTVRSNNGTATFQGLQISKAGVYQFGAGATPDLFGVSLPFEIQSTTVELSTVGSDQVKGYEMVAFPIQPTTSALPGALEGSLGPFKDTDWRCGHWTNTKLTDGHQGGYLKVGSDPLELAPAAGYWLLTRESKKITILGTPDLSQRIEIPLSGGAGTWHQIGNPMRRSVPVSSIKIRSASGQETPLLQSQLTDPYLYSWRDGDYVHVPLPGTASGAMDSLRGYWIYKKSESPITLVIDRYSSQPSSVAHDPLPASTMLDTATPRWELRLNAVQGKLASNGVQVGVIESAERTLSYRLPPPPPGQSLRLWLEPLEGNDGSPMSALFQSAGDSFQASLIVSGAAEGTPIRLMYDGALPVGYDISLADPNTDIRRRFEGNRLDLPAGARRRGFRLLISTTDGRNPVPGPGLRLAATPNPFNASTRLTATGVLGGRGIITITDVSGRFFRRQCVDLTAGAETTWDWDGTDGAGHPAASGIYFAVFDLGQSRTISRLVRVRR